MIVLMLDGCRLFKFDEALADGSKRKHGLKFLDKQTLKTIPDTVIAHACAPNEVATDSGKYAC